MHSNREYLDTRQKNEKWKNNYPNSRQKLKSVFRTREPIIRKKLQSTTTHTGYIEVIMQGKCGRNTETTFDIR